MQFEILSDEEIAAYDAAVKEHEGEDIYEEPCDRCGGKVVATGGNGYYNGSYQCYTLFLRCENCGDYEVEFV